MRVVSNRMLVDFANMHPRAHVPLQTWRKLLETSEYASFSDLKRTFNHVDKVGDYVVFDIAGNHYRIVAAIHFNTQMLFVRHVFTHREYDAWRP